MSKETIHKLKLSNIEYPASVVSELEIIRKIFGEIEIIKVRQCFGGTSMKIWFKVKGENNDK
jgi:hypothetical protein